MGKLVAYAGCFEVSSVARGVLEVGLWCGDVCLKAWLRDDFEIDGDGVWVVNEWRFYVIFRISGVFGYFLNCLTIYCIWWLRDILGVCRSRCRSGLLNCVGI